MQEQTEHLYKYITNEQHRRGVVGDLVWEWRVGVVKTLKDNGSWEWWVDDYVYIVQLKKRKQRKTLKDADYLVSCHVEGKQHKIQWGCACMSKEQLEKAYALLTEIIAEIDLKLVEKANARKEWLQAYAQNYRRPKARGES